MICVSTSNLKLWSSISNSLQYNTYFKFHFLNLYSNIIKQSKQKFESKIKEFQVICEETINPCIL